LKTVFCEIRFSKPALGKAFRGIARKKIILESAVAANPAKQSRDAKLYFPQKSTRKNASAIPHRAGVRDENSCARPGMFAVSSCATF
jgi:hypothetical protein